MKKTISIISAFFLFSCLILLCCWEKPVAASTNLLNYIDVHVTYGGADVDNARVTISDGGGVVKGPSYTSKSGHVSFDNGGLTIPDNYTISASRDVDCGNLGIYYEGNNAYYTVPITGGCGEW